MDHNELLTVIRQLENLGHFDQIETVINQWLDERDDEFTSNYMKLMRGEYK